MFCNFGHDASWLRDKLVRCCSHIGWLLNIERRKLLTQKHNHHRNSSHQMDPNGLFVYSLPGFISHWWLRCRFSSMGPAGLCEHAKRCGISFEGCLTCMLLTWVGALRPTRFDIRTVTMIRRLHALQRDLDVGFRRLVRQVVGVMGSPSDNGVASSCDATHVSTLNCIAMVSLHTRQPRAMAPPRSSRREAQGHPLSGARTWGGLTAMFADPFPLAWAACAAAQGWARRWWGGLSVAVQRAVCSAVYGTWSMPPLSGDADAMSSATVLDQAEAALPSRLRCRAACQLR